MPEAPLTRLDRASIAVLVALVIGCGVLTEIRGAFAQRRHTDVGVYLRGSWALRNGLDPYAVTDDNGWHYAYPPLLAIALIPFADAPAGVEQPKLAVPYPVSVGLWYLVSAALLFWATHHLSRALEETAAEPLPTAGQRRYWWTRGWPVWLCMPAIGSTLAKGQSNMLVLALLTGVIAAAIRGRRAVAGWCLAGAVCIKVFPALLVAYPLVRRDWRMLGHFPLAMIAGIVVVPVLALGPDRAWTTTETFVGQILLPGLTTAPGVMSRELTDMTGTDNQSVRAIIHNALNLDGATRPPMASTGTKIAHAVISLGLIVWTFWAARRISDARYRTLFTLSGLVIVAVAATPVNHTHYMVLAVPGVLGLVFWEMERRRRLVWGPALWVVLVLHVVSGIYPRLPFLPGYQAARDLGVTLLGTLLVGWAGLKFSATREPGAAAPGAVEGATIRLPSVRVFK